MVRLYIIRHGDPDYDTNKENGGSLTENGIAEATALSRALSLEGMTHAYTSPLGRAKLTAELALVGIPKFSNRYYGEQEIESSGDRSDSKLNNFEANVQVEDWCRELSTWRQSSHLDEFPLKHPKKKAPALWDFPAPIIRNQLHDITKGETESKGWKESCPDYKVYQNEFAKFKREADEFLSRHGILRGTDSNNYHLSKELASAPENRQQKIGIFCHGGMGLTFLSHLLSIPPPMVHSSMWLPPSSVTTVIFDEHSTSDGDIIVSPRAIQIGGTNHLSAAGLQISNSLYEDNGERPAGIKHNFW
jgi:probable phosphoglycerate mutase